MRKRKLAIDIDGVVANMHTIWLKEYNNINHTNYQLKDITSWDFGSINCMAEEFYRIYDKVWLEQSHDIKNLLDKTLLVQLYKKMDVYFLTSRTSSTVDSLVEWLALNQLSEIPLIINDPNTDKSDLEYDIYIDDNPSMVHTIAEKTSRLLLLVHQPWNSATKIQDLIAKYHNIVECRDVNHGLQILNNGIRESAFILK